MSLRARLVLALMALAVLPTAVFTLFTLDQLDRSTGRWFRPGVDRALESGVEVSKSALTRLETSALALSDEMARRLNAAPGASANTLARELLRGSGADVVQIYRRQGEGWVLVDNVVPEGILLPEPLDFRSAIDEALAATRIIRSNRGALAAVTAIGRDRAAVAAMWVPESFFADLDSIGYAHGYYRQLGVLVDVQRRFVWALVAALGVTLAALAYIVARGLAGQMSRPLGELSGALSRVASGDLAVRVRPGGAREMRALGDAFNVMTARLAEARGKLQEAEREAAWREVARRLAHEFKNILTPMSLSLHRLNRRAEAVAPAERQAAVESLAALGRGVEHLARLAEQFSQYARLPEPRLEPLDLTETTREAARLHEHEGVTVIEHGGPSLPVRGDSLLLSRAIHNLLLNACEASPRGGTVEVRTRREGADAVIEIIDSGPGLPPEWAERIFEPYVSTKKRGSGLGLSLVRDIAEQHHGTVTIENRKDGGARARLVVPLRDDVT